MSSKSSTCRACPVRELSACSYAITMLEIEGTAHVGLPVYCTFTDAHARRPTVTVRAARGSKSYKYSQNGISLAAKVTEGVLCTHTSCRGPLLALSCSRLRLPLDMGPCRLLGRLCLTPCTDRAGVCSSWEGCRKRWEEPELAGEPSELLL